MTNFLIAPSAFKGSFSAKEIAGALNSGLSDWASSHNHSINSKIIPLADGGDGTVEAIFAAAGGKLHETECPGALGEVRKAVWLDLNGTAVIELASACGIAGLSELKPLEAHTRGLGVIIKRIVEKEKFKNIVIAVGGSASTDGGSGAISEMGALFYDSDGNQLKPSGGGALSEIARCDLSRLKKTYDKTDVKVATDVVNPLLGQEGAACIFGPQKGAGRQDIYILETGLKKFADILETACNKQFRSIRGSGAAGGTAFGLACAVGAEIISGFDWISSLTGLEDAVKSCDIVITGEGRFDRSSLSGKTTGKLLDFCLLYNKELWIVAGSANDKIAVGANCKIIVPPSSAEQADLMDIQKALSEFAAEHFA